MIKRVFSLLLFTVAGFGLMISAAYFLQEKLLFHPEKLPLSYQFEFSNPFEELYISVASDVTINALYFPAEKSQGVILYFHGNAGSLRNWGDVAEDFLTHQYDFFIFDYRSYGKSTGSISEEALHNDALMVYQYILKHYPDKKIIVYGRSLGTGLAAALAAENEVEQLILESPYYSMIDLAHHLIPWIPHKWILKYHLRTDLYLRQVQCPILIFHGRQDNTIYFGSSLKLTKLFKPGDELVEIDNAGHNDIAAFPLYHHKLWEVLNDGIVKEPETLF